MIGGGRTWQKGKLASVKFVAFVVSVSPGAEQSRQSKMESSYDWIQTRAIRPVQPSAPRDARHRSLSTARRALHVRYVARAQRASPILNGKKFPGSRQHEEQSRHRRLHCNRSSASRFHTATPKSSRRQIRRRPAHLSDRLCPLAEVNRSIFHPTSVSRSNRLGQDK